MNIRDIRSEIDKIDSEIIELLSKRNSLIIKAGQSKCSVREVNDPDRAEHIIWNVKKKAVRSGLDPVVAEKIYRKIIDCFTFREMHEFSGMAIEYQDV